MLTQTIEISGLEQECRDDILITFLHELSHHIETVNTGHSGHQKSFYDVHIKLLKTAIDLDVFKIDAIIHNETSNAGNIKKLARLLGNYQKQGEDTISNYVNIDFMKDMLDKPVVSKTFKAKCLYQEKDLFKDRRYIWDAVEEIWHKTLDNRCDINEEHKILTDAGYSLISIDKKVYYVKHLTICVTGKTYDYKDTLSKLNYTYVSNEKMWIKQILVNEARKEINKIQKCYGIKVFYKF